MAIIVGSGSYSLAREVDTDFAPIAPHKINVEVLEIKGLLPSMIPIVQSRELPDGVFILRAEVESLNTLRISLWNATSSTVTLGPLKITVVAL